MGTGPEDQGGGENWLAQQRGVLDKGRAKVVQGELRRPTVKVGLGFGDDSRTSTISSVAGTGMSPYELGVREGKVQGGVIDSAEIRATHDANAKKKLEEKNTQKARKKNLFGF